MDFHQCLEKLKFIFVKMILMFVEFTFSYIELSIIFVILTWKKYGCKSWTFLETNSVILNKKSIGKWSDENCPNEHLGENCLAGKC